MIKSIAEYVWLDGNDEPQLRAKTKIIESETQLGVNPEEFPEWQFDGSSTNQAEGISSDCILVPVKVIADPFRHIQAYGSICYIVLCEVMNPDGTPHKTNSRAILREAIENNEHYDPWIGFEQEYTIFSKNERPLGWPEDKEPEPQGPYYCAAGAGNVAGRGIVEEHLAACLRSNLSVCGVNAEVMLGQWEFQVGAGCPIEMSDELWLARYLLYRVGERYDCRISLDPKPVEGSWNGAGMHTNYSTQTMREENGMEMIELACEALSTEQAIRRHFKNYGKGYERRLTGEYETCSYQEFKYDVSDRTASIRIPLHVAQAGCGYFEDRRPNANADPYKVATVLTDSVCFEVVSNTLENQIVT